MSNNASVNNDHINTLVEKLRSKMRDFAVMDGQGELIGEVKDLMLDANSELNLVISQVASRQSSRPLLLLSKLIKKIEPQDKAIFVDVSKAEMENLPGYETTEIQGQDASFTAALEPQEQNSGVLAASEASEILEEEIVRLLEERLVVGRNKRKVGEVIVRKEIETRMVQVPIRREKLIVEQVSPERKQLAEIDLGQEEILGIELTEEETVAGDTLIVKGDFDSPKTASLLLNAIALERRHGCKTIKVQIVVEDTERQKTYQEWFDRCSGSKSIPSNP